MRPPSPPCVCQLYCADPMIHAARRAMMSVHDVPQAVRFFTTLSRVFPGGFPSMRTSLSPDRRPQSCAVLFGMTTQVKKLPLVWPTGMIPQTFFLLLRVRQS